MKAQNILLNTLTTLLDIFILSTFIRTCREKAGPQCPYQTKTAGSVVYTENLCCTESAAAILPPLSSSEKKDAFKCFFSYAYRKYNIFELGNILLNFYL